MPTSYCIKSSELPTKMRQCARLFENVCAQCVKKYPDKICLYWYTYNAVSNLFILT